MTLNTTGPISLGGSTTGQSINLELSQSATAQVSMDDANVRSLAGVASGAITMPTDFYGKSAGTPVITLTSRNVTSFSGGILSANAGWRASNDSYVYTGVGSGAPTYTQREQWDSIPATVGNYEIYVSYTGDTPSGTFNTWLNLGTTRTWLLTASPGNVLAATLSVQIRDTATSTVQATATINLTADAV